MKLSVVIPVHNEVASVADTVVSVDTVLSEAAIDHEIIVVDDASRDGTGELLQRLACKAVLVTRGSDGMALFERGRPPLHIPVHGSDQVADVTGAGDTVIATFTLALASGASPEEAARLANYAGGIVVMKHATATVSADELVAAVRGSGRP